MITYTTITEKLVTDAHLRPLYEANHWIAYTQTISDLTTLLTHTQQHLCAWDGDTLVGFARTIGDGIYVECLQDILVLPSYQKQGIGSELLTRLLNEHKHIQQFFLLTDNSPFNKDILRWYEKHHLKPFTSMQTTGFFR